MQFTDKQKKDFARYVAIQHGGRYNMFDPRARALTNMDRAEWVFCMEHYDALEQATATQVANQGE